MKRYRIILADDHRMFRAGLKTLIEREDRFDVVDEACDGFDLLEKLKGGKCDLIVMDLSMPRMDGLTAMEQIAARYPRVRILVLTMHKDPAFFRDAMSCGASGYLLKDDAFEKLVRAMDVLINGGQFFSPSVTDLLKEEQVGRTDRAEARSIPAIDVLTRREREVLRLIATGLANKNIARQLNISVRTVEVHRSNLTKKLGLKSTAGLVRYTLENAFTESDFS